MLYSTHRRQLAEGVDRFYDRNKRLVIKEMVLSAIPNFMRRDIVFRIAGYSTCCGNVQVVVAVGGRGALLFLVLPDAICI